MNIQVTITVIYSFLQTAECFWLPSNFRSAAASLSRQVILLNEGDLIIYFFYISPSKFIQSLFFLSVKAFRRVMTKKLRGLFESDF